MLPFMITGKQQLCDKTLNLFNICISKMLGSLSGLFLLDTVTRPYVDWCPSP